MSFPAVSKEAPAGKPMVKWNVIVLETKEEFVKPTFSKVEATTATDIWTLDYCLVSNVVDFSTIKLVEDLVLRIDDSPLLQNGSVFLKIIFYVFEKCQETPT